MLYDFVCLTCGGKNLEYEKWVNCREPVKFHPGDHIVYGPPRIDDTNALGAECCYICSNCGEKPHYCGSYLYDEDDLRSYLSLPLDERRKMDRDYMAALEERAEMEDEEDIFDEPDATEPKEVQHVEAQK